MAGRYPSVIIIANTPVEDGVIQAWHALLVKSQHDQAPPRRTVAAARAFQEASRQAFAQDFDVWAHKAPAIRILQANGDGPFHMERIWYKQFFNRRARRLEYQRRVNGLHTVKGPPLARAASG